jgi:hypothetical protein
MAKVELMINLVHQRFWAVVAWRYWTLLIRSLHGYLGS